MLSIACALYSMNKDVERVVSSFTADPEREINADTNFLVTLYQGDQVIRLTENQLIGLTDAANKAKKRIFNEH